MTTRRVSGAAGRKVTRRGLAPRLPAAVRAALLRERVETLLANKTAAAVVGLLAVLGGIWWALLTFGELADEVAEGESRALDERALALVRSVESPALDVVARSFSLLGSEVVAVLLVVFILVWAWRRRWGQMVALLAVTGGAQLLNNVLKDHFQRPRPAPVMGLIPAQHWSFPSGHAMVAAAFYLFLAYAAWRMLLGWWRLAAVGGLVLLVVLIGWSRMYLGVHYLTDVVAGYCAGAAWAGAVMVAHRLIAGRRWRWRRAGRA